MAGNWIKIHRGLKDHDLWTAESFTRGQAWVDLLMLANWADGFVRIRDIRVDLTRGQLAAGSRWLSSRWGWSRGKVSRFLNELETDHRIDQRKTSLTNVVTIVNYDSYQSDVAADQTAGRTTDGPTKEETKNKKEEIRKDTVEKLSPELDTVEFGNAWSEWEQHRRENKKKLTPLAVKRQMKLLAKMGHDRAIAAIHHSIAQGYTGIYEAGSRGSGNSKPEMFAGINEFMEEHEDDQK